MEGCEEIKWKNIYDLLDSTNDVEELVNCIKKEKKLFKHNEESFSGCPLYRVIVRDQKGKFESHFIIKAENNRYCAGSYDIFNKAIIYQRHTYPLGFFSKAKNVYLINEENIEMGTKEIKINVPDGYEIDKENSTFECIKFKKKEVSWRSTETNSSNYINKMSGYTIGVGSELLEIKNWLHTKFNRFLFATEKQAKSALAMAQITQIMANDKRFGGVVTDEERRNEEICKYTIARNKYGGIETNRWVTCNYNLLTFHTREQCDLFLEENEDLVKDYLMID